MYIELNQNSAGCKWQLVSNRCSINWFTFVIWPLFDLRFQNMLIQSNVGIRSITLWIVQWKWSFPLIRNLDVAQLFPVNSVGLFFRNFNFWLLDLQCPYYQWYEVPKSFNLGDDPDSVLRADTELPPADDNFVPPSILPFGQRKYRLSHGRWDVWLMVIKLY